MFVILSLGYLLCSNSNNAAIMAMNFIKHREEPTGRIVGVSHFLSTWPARLREKPKCKVKAN